MYNWKEILLDVVGGYEEAMPHFNPPTYTQEEINSIRAKIEHANLKQVKDDNEFKEIKQFFKTHTIPLEVIDEISKEISKAEISKAATDNWVLVHDFDPENLRPANYDLRLGEEVYVTAEKLPRKLTDTESTIAIEPGEFGILMTYEYIHIPLDRLGLISLRFNYKKQGLVNISGFHVDPGFTGRIVFSVFNTGPRSVVLRYKEPVFMIMFEEMNEIDPRSGYGSGGFSYQKHIPVDIITSLGGESVSVIKLDRRLRKLETDLRILEAILIGLVIAGVSYLASRFIFK